MITKLTPTVQPSRSTTLLRDRMGMSTEADSITFAVDDLQWHLGSSFTPDLTHAHLLHVLHAENELELSVQVSGTRYPIAPGDSMTVSAGESIELPSDAILVNLVRSSLTTSAPTHGSERFDGFNRCTTYGVEGFERWKLTTPLVMEIASRAAVMVISGSIGCIANGVVESLHVGETALVRQETVHLIPDGLAYVLIIS